MLTGAGRAFSSGADLRAGGELGERRQARRAARPLREIYNPLILRVRTIPKPVIAAVNGPAVGIGCSLALAADLVVAARSAYFLLAFVNIGLGLDGGASQTLVARVGHARAFEIAYLGERIAAEQALELGPDQPGRRRRRARTARAAELAARLAAGPPGSYAAIKRTINDRAYAGFEELLDLEAELQQERAESKDFAEGVLAFMQKRPPNFTGELIGPTMNLAQILTDAAERDPDHVAIKLDDAELTYAQLDGATAHVAGLLREHGFEPGDRVGIMLPNVPYFPVCYYGVLRAGGDRRADERAAQEARGRLLPEGLGGQAAVRLGGLRRGRAGRRRAGRRRVHAGRAGRVREQVGAAEPVTEVADTADDDTAVILYTSGTTGQPKGAELTHANLTRNAQASRDLFGLGAEAIMLGALPLFHAFGQTCGMNATVGGGGTLTLIPRFDPAKALEIIQRDHVNVFQGVPTMYGAMLHHPDRESYDTSPCRCAPRADRRCRSS